MGILRIATTVVYLHILHGNLLNTMHFMASENRALTVAEYTCPAGHR